MERIIDLQLRHKERGDGAAMINENNNAPEIEIFLILFFFFFGSLSTFFFSSHPLPHLPTMAVWTVHVHCDLWAIAWHHFFPPLTPLCSLPLSQSPFSCFSLLSLFLSCSLCSQSDHAAPRLGPLVLFARRHIFNLN